MNTSWVKQRLTDIRFWIIFFFLIRLVGITNAPLEIGHNWRQSLTNMVARNFLEVRANLLYPMIDMAGERSGIMGSEFPFFNWLIYLTAEGFGYEHWYGRLINLIVSSVGLYFFYKLLRALFNERLAFSATIVLCSSIWFAFSRKIMPDTFSVALMIIGLYYAYCYLTKARWAHLLLFTLLAGLGMLCKIPALSLLSVLAITLFVKEIPLRRKLLLYSAATLAFGITCAWYFYWVPYLLAEYKFQLYFPKGMLEGLLEIIPEWQNLLRRFYFSSLKSFIALAFMLGGLFLIIKSNKWQLKLGLSLISLVFAAFIIKTGAVFPLHNYYIIPFTPIMALLVGYALSAIPPRYQYIALTLIVIEGVGNQQHDFFVKDSQRYLLELEETVAKAAPDNERIIINGGLSPQRMYFAHRKGWSLNNEQLSTPGFVDSVSHLGAAYLVIDQSDYTPKDAKWPIIHEDEHFLIYRLKD